MIDLTLYRGFVGRAVAGREGIGMPAISVDVGDGVVVY
jgi:hypothetical protein